MSARLYWAAVGIAAVAILAGIATLQPPASANVQVRLLQEFYTNQFYIATAIGLVVGIVAALHARRRIYHVPRDRGEDFAGRVIGRGLLAGAIASIVDAIVVTLLAASAELDPLAPGEKIRLVVPTGLSVIAMTVAFVAALLSYALVIRVRAWSGQYALVKRF